MAVRRRSDHSIDKRLTGCQRAIFFAGPAPGAPAVSGDAPCSGHGLTWRRPASRYKKYRFRLPWPDVHHLYVPVLSVTGTGAERGRFSQRPFAGLPASRVRVFRCGHRCEMDSHTTTYCAVRGARIKQTMTIGTMAITFPGGVLPPHTLFPSTARRRPVVALLALACLLLCHAAQADRGARSDFDHAISGFPLSGAHARTPCEACHANGVFKGTPSQCVYCHQSGSRLSSTSKPPRHIPTHASCDTCHVSTTAWTDARFNHFSSGGIACITCHNGVASTGKPPRHVPSPPTCDSCHRSTATWSGARYDHAGVAAGCAVCHSGAYWEVPGPPPSHIPARLTNCEACHRSTSNWLSF